MAEVKKEVLRPTESLGHHEFERIGRQAVHFDQRAKYSYDADVYNSLKEKAKERENLLREVVGDDAHDDTVVSLTEA